MKIDLHVHCRERSSCASSSEEEQIRAAINNGLNAIVFTDHGRFMPQKRLKELNKKYAPFKIYSGIELVIEWEDLLVIGVNKSSLERKEWSYVKLYNFVKKHKGFIALAHPFRYHSIGIDIENYPPHAIEAYSNNISSENVKDIMEVSNRLGLPVLCNSDAHDEDQIGSYYNILDRTPDNEMELVDMLISGQFKCNLPDHIKGALFAS
ncbi:PHP domain-containing protein [Candidatus Poribacteria bacterium]|nr:PHP domain-containing protein [Candidatus Poribacteria bacterium]